jgi:hypothetical protein
LKNKLNGEKEKNLFKNENSVGCVGATAELHPAGVTVFIRDYGVLQGGFQETEKQSQFKSSKE